MIKELDKKDGLYYKVPEGVHNIAEMIKHLHKHGITIPGDFGTQLWAPPGGEVEGSLALIVFPQGDVWLVDVIESWAQQIMKAGKPVNKKLLKFRTCSDGVQEVHLTFPHKLIVSALPTPMLSFLTVPSDPTYTDDDTVYEAQVYMGLTVKAYFENILGPTLITSLSKAMGDTDAKVDLENMPVDEFIN